MACAQILRCSFDNAAGRPTYARAIVSWVETKTDVTRPTVSTKRRMMAETGTVVGAFLFALIGLVVAVCAVSQPVTLLAGRHASRSV